MPSKESEPLQGEDVSEKSDVLSKSCTAVPTDGKTRHGSVPRPSIYTLQARRTHQQRDASVTDEHLIPPLVFATSSPSFVCMY